MRWLNLAKQIITEVDILQIRHKIIQVMILASLVSGPLEVGRGPPSKFFLGAFSLNRIMFGLYSAKVRFFFVASSVRYKSGFVHIRFFINRSFGLRQLCVDVGGICARLPA